MLKLVVVFFVLWLLTALGIRRVHLLRGRMADVAKDFTCAFLAVAIVAALAALVIL